MKRHTMNSVRTAIAIILVAGVTCTATGCNWPLYWYLYLPLFG